MSKANDDELIARPLDDPRGTENIRAFLRVFDILSDDPEAQRLWLIEHLKCEANVNYAMRARIAELEKKQ